MAGDDAVSVRHGGSVCKDAGNAEAVVATDDDDDDDNDTAVDDSAAGQSSFSSLHRPLAVYDECFASFLCVADDDGAESDGRSGAPKAEEEDSAAVVAGPAIVAPRRRTDVVTTELSRLSSTL